MLPFFLTNTFDSAPAAARDFFLGKCSRVTNAQANRIGNSIGKATAEFEIGFAKEHKLNNFPAVLVRSQLPVKFRDKLIISRNMFLSLIRWDK